MLIWILAIIFGFQSNILEQNKNTHKGVEPQEKLKLGTIEPQVQFTETYTYNTEKALVNILCSKMKSILH